MTAPVLDRPATRTLVCTAGCGWDLDPAAAAGGFTTHPGCDLPERVPQAKRWQCGYLGCDATGTAKGDHDAINRIRMHEHVHHKPTRPVRAGRNR